MKFSDAEDQPSTLETGKENLRDYEERSPSNICVVDLGQARWLQERFIEEDKIDFSVLRRD